MSGYHLHLCDFERPLRFKNLSSINRGRTIDKVDADGVEQALKPFTLILILIMTLNVNRTMTAKMLCAFCTGHLLQYSGLPLTLIL